ncbi:MAG: carboxypeptidase regulatory-like domain-containing protein, partial [Rhodothermales bacterium]
MKSTHFLTLLLAAALSQGVAVAQTAHLTGTVTDASDGQTLPGAHVLLFDSNQQYGAVSDSVGMYHLT